MDGIFISLIPVSMGNPHAVIFVDDIKTAPLIAIGPRIERHEAFPDGVNVEFVEIISENKLCMRVWERGSGVTLVCGTGACTSVMAVVYTHNSHYDETVWFELDGGTLKVKINPDNPVQMTGPAETVYEGETEIC